MDRPINYSLHPFALAIIIMLSTTNLMGQYDAFTFQALILDETAYPAVNTSVDIRTTIYADRALNDIYYEEQKSLTTSASGAINYAIGTGENLQGTITEIDWLAGLPYIGISYDLGDGRGWQETEPAPFSLVPFCFRSKYVVCRNGITGQSGAQGPSGEQGPATPAGAQGNFGSQGPAGDPGIPVVDPLSATPTSPQEGRVYLDDGTNTPDGLPGFRYFDGNQWIEL